MWPFNSRNKLWLYRGLRMQPGALVQPFGSQQFTDDPGVALHYAVMAGEAWSVGPRWAGGFSRQAVDARVCTEAVMVRFKAERSSLLPGAGPGAYAYAGDPITSEGYAVIRMAVAELEPMLPTPRHLGDRTMTVIAEQLWRARG